MRKKRLKNLLFGVLLMSISCGSSNSTNLETSEIIKDLSLPGCFELELISKKVESFDTDCAIEYIFRQNGCFADFINLTMDNKNGTWSYHSNIWEFSPTEETRKSSKYHEAVYLEKYAVLYVVSRND